MGLGSGFTLPSVNTLITSSTTSEQRGGITSIYGSFRFLGVAIGPPVFSLLFKVGEKVMFWFGSGVALLVVGLVFVFLKEEKLVTNGSKQDESKTTKNEAIVRGIEKEKSFNFKKNKLR